MTKKKSGVSMLIQAKQQTRQRIRLKKHNRLGAEITIKKLDFRDFLVGEDVVMKRKTIQDLVGTYTQKFLFYQLFRMKEASPQSFLLIEWFLGVLRKFRKITPESLKGALFALVQDNIPVVPTTDYKDVPRLLMTATKQLLKEGRENAVIRHQPKAKNIKDKQLYTVTGLPQVGPILAEKMFKKRGSVRKVFCSSKEELMKVDGVGSLITSGIDVLDAPYKEEKAKERILSTDE
jgi:ERCC4-type nuclease